MKVAHPHVRRRRARSATLVLVGFMSILGIAFFRAQVMRGTAWALQSDSNRLRVVPVPAPRGTIFDRYGEIIADNVPSYSVSLFPAPLDSIEASLRRLQPVLGFDDERIASLMEDAAADRRQPLLIDADADYDVVATLEEMRPTFPGIFLEMRPKRRYMGGEALGHALGYVGEISGDELLLPAFEGYEQRMMIGKDGLEREYEAALQGTQGIRYLEVDAVGRVVGSFAGEAAAPALPGEDLRLNLDLGLMEYIQEIFPEDRLGAVVMLNVEDGGVIALYSSPSFDPNAFVGGIDPDLWAYLNQDPTRPLFNRAVRGLYPPASTWKVATAAIALDMGVLDPHEFMSAQCTGSFAYGRDVRGCLGNHGYLDLSGALANSCNVYFYQVGLRIGLENLVREGTRFGFSDPCGIDLPVERNGIFPESLDFFRRQTGYAPTENEVLSLAIGQGPNSQTPLKMAQFYVALARDGTAPAPQLSQDASRAQREPAWSLGLSEENLDAIRQGLREVTDVGGTASMSSLQYWDLLGKTGTAQQGLPGDPSHAWFLGIAGPWGEPAEVVVAVIVEEGVSGSGMAAPVAAKALDFHLRRRHGIPTDTTQTLREHYQRGVPAPWAGRAAEARELGTAVTGF